MSEMSWARRMGVRLSGASGAHGVLLAGVAVLLLSGCGGKEERKQTEESAVAEVAVAEVAVADAVYQERVRGQWLPGTVHPLNRTVLAAQLMGTVAVADFTIGQEVEAGAPLVVLAAEEVKAQLEQARAMVAEVERNYAREQALLAQNATPAENVRALEDALRIARARLQEAQTMESYRTVRAPFAGTITSRAVWRGDLAMPGRELLTLEGFGTLQVYAQVPDSLSALAKGTQVEIEADGRRFRAVLEEWSPAADPASRTRLAKLTVPDGTPVRSGQYVRVSWPAGVTRTLTIPAAATSPMGQIERVFVVDGERARLRIVRTGPIVDGQVSIISGLEAGERVILNPARSLRDGQRVRVRP